MWKEFCLHGSIPAHVTQKSIHNFLSTGRKYAVQGSELMRQGRKVLQKEELDRVWEEFHT